MRFEELVSNGPNALGNTELERPDKKLKREMMNGPFQKSLTLAAIGGPTYITAQTIVQQVSYALSDSLWTYSPESFGLDELVKEWKELMVDNAYGKPTKLEAMQIRQGAGSIVLGCIFSPDFDLKKRFFPQSVLASSASLPYLRTALDQLSNLHTVASPCVIHVAAIDYAAASSKLVTDYETAMTVAAETELAMVASFSGHQSQHMALFATVLANLMPTMHVYDGVHVARETTRLIDTLDFKGLHNVYKAVLQEISNPALKRASLDTKVVRALDAFNQELGTVYNVFEYSGHNEPEIVLVVFGSVEASLGSEIAVNLSKSGVKVGLLAVRVYRPFIESEFLTRLPQSVKAIGVLGQVHDAYAVSDGTVHSHLYDDVFAAVTFAGQWAIKPTVTDIKYPREQVWTQIQMAAAFQLLSPKPLLRLPHDDSENYQLQLLDPSNVQQYTFWDLDDSPAADASIMLGQDLAEDSSNNVTFKREHDNLIEGGVSRTDIRRSKLAIDAPYPADSADLVVVGDQSLLKHFDLTKALKRGGKVLLKYPAVKDVELEGKLPLHFKKAAAAMEAQLFILDPSAVEDLSKEPETETYLLQAAFLRVAFSTLEKIGLQRLAKVGSSSAILEDVAKKLDQTLREIEVPIDWAGLEDEADAPKLAGETTVNSFAGYDKSETEAPTYLRDWQTVAKGLAFKEACGSKLSLRPDVAVKTHRVHIKENRRLTPLTYERNIFHVEFDLGNSGLTYDIGEALGIHAENDETQVKEFIKFYKLDPQEVVEVPTRDDSKVLENRTVYQSLMQNIDIFGRPPKRFYEALADFADDPKEEKELRALSGPEGALEFKRRGEVDTVTFADILLEFPSAHPSFHDIVRIVNPMKRREYSIASCQKVTPTSVALMIVVVGWVDTKKRDRWGQATKYLNKLKIGDEVVVSVKPSVMKLPANSTQPLIMAGLGTGLAPFRAFVQHRAWEKQQGKKIGSVLLYMGSRHQREEYCYGEEWEAYQDAGIITLLGRAFSRDQPQKIYIQDRMRQTINDIIQAYIKEDGAFYLCGPTWPVPDVTNVLEEAIARDAKAVGKKIDPRKEIDRLKDLSRYVLEVY